MSRLGKYNTSQRTRECNHQQRSLRAAPGSSEALWRGTFWSRGWTWSLLTDLRSRRISSQNFSQPRLTSLIGDVCDASILETPGRFQYVFHFASTPSPHAYKADPLGTLRSGSIGTMNTLELARRHRARYVFASTSEVYGDPLQHPQSEQYWGNVNPTGPRSCYDESKRFGEAYVTAFAAVNGLSAVIVWIFNTYGPGMHPSDGRVLSTFVRQAPCGEPLTVYGDGSQTRSLCYIDDLVPGIWRLARSSFHNGPVNPGSDHEISVLKLAETVIAVLDSAGHIAFEAADDSEPRRRRPDVSLARALIGWQPTMSLPDGIRRTAAWMANEIAFPP